MVRSLPLAEWPEPDRVAWTDACRPNVRLQRGGRAAHLKPVTQHDLAQRFGYYLDFLDRTDRLCLDRSALTELAPDIVADYIDELSGRVSSVTVHGMTYKLRRTAELLDSNLDLSWLKDIELDLNDRKRPKSKTGRLVFSNRIVEAGLGMIKAAEADANRTHLQRARCARDGVLIAILAVCPIRLKNIALLTIGDTIARTGEQWWLTLPDMDTKSKRLDHRSVPQELTAWIDLYVDQYRPKFPPCGNAMWPSQYGGQLEQGSVQRLITQTTKKTLDVAIGPHMFRHCVPYTIANTDGSKIGLASALLQHSDPRTTEKHYNLGHSVESSKIFAGLVSKLETSPDRSTDERVVTAIGTAPQNRKGA